MALRAPTRAAREAGCRQGHPGDAPRRSTTASSHVSTGDMFRTQAAQGTAFGLEAKRYMDAGELVPDEIVVGVDRGVPRARAARSATASCSTASRARCTRPRELDRVLDGRAARPRRSTSTCRARSCSTGIAGRRVCENCQRVYHVNLPPTYDWICDTCGGAVAPARRRHRRGGRAPARAVRAARRCRSSTTTGRAGCSTTVDGVGEGDEVFERLVKVVDEQLS